MPFAIASIVVVVLSFAISAEAANYYSVRNQLISARRRRADDEKIKTLFEEWTARRGKIYSEIGEKGKRFDVFKDNLKFVEDHNNGNNNCTYRLGLNKFADLTNEEYRAAYLPEFVDWRERRAVGPVKDSWTLGLDTPQTEKALQKASSHQPICVAIEASGRALQLYSSGVFTGDCGAHLDHGVVVVGYGSESEVDYWIVKNSWGTDWGENGYLKLARNVDIPGGKCGIVMGAYYAMKGKKSTNLDIDNGYHKAE